MRRLALLMALGGAGITGVVLLLAGGGTATAAHPVDALLRGTFTMKGKITVASHVHGERSGQHVTRSWSFYPSCSSGGCPSVVLKRFRSGSHVLDKITLKRKHPGVYQGSHRFWLTLKCNGARVKKGGYANETIKVKILHAISNGGTKVASAIHATYNNPSRYNKTHCPGGIGHDAATYSGHLNSTALAASANGGYLILTSDGGVYNFGKASLHGSDAGKLRVKVRALRIATDSSSGGYWILKSDGGVDAFGVPALGSLAGKLHGTRPVWIAASPSGGYLILTADGSVHAFGSAKWHGSDKGKLGHHVHAVSLAVNSSGGYWVLKSNGDVNAFGAPKSGSLKGKLHGTQAVAIAAAKKGYWILTADGGVHSFGGSGWHGSDQGKLGNGKRATSLAADPVKAGYWILKSNGAVDGFDAPSLGGL